MIMLFEFSDCHTERPSEAVVFCAFCKWERSHTCPISKHSKRFDTSKHGYM